MDASNPINATIEIQLGRGYVTVIDDCDADLAELTWFCANMGRKALKNQPYACTVTSRRIERKKLLLHRIILERMLGRPLSPKEVPDHINGDRLDNRRANLRIATPQQNSWNARRRRNSGDLPKGVKLRRDGKKWVARITYMYKQIHLGSFDSPEEAHQAYVEAARKYFGEFANAG